VPIAIEFKDGGDGVLLTTSMTTTFTWIDSGDHITIDAADIVINTDIVLPEALLSDTLSNASVRGNLILESLEISLSSIETDNPTLAWQPTIRFEPHISNPHYITWTNQSPAYNEPLIDANTTPSPSSFGAGTWFYNQGNTVVKLAVDANGTADQTSVVDDTSAQHWANWDIQQNNLELTHIDSNADHSAKLYVLEEFEAGYRWARIDDTEGNKSLSAGLIIKGDESLTFTEEDWIGIWSYDNELIMFTGDHFRRYAIAGWTNIWRYVSNQQSLVWEAYEQGEHGWRDFCNPLSIHPCIANAKQELKPITKTGSGYWIIRTDEFIPGAKNQSLVLANKTPALNEFGDWIYTNITNFFEATSSGYRVWSFWRHHLLISDAVQSHFDEYGPNTIPIQINDGKIIFSEDQTTWVIELIEQDENGVLVCKYAENSSCTPGTEFLLLNKSPAKMSVTAEGEGYVDYSMDYEHFGTPRELTLTPKDGYEMAKVEGCGGSLNGNTYITAPIRENCTVAVTFRKTD
jgi:hypothetical protein